VLETEDVPALDDVNAADTCSVDACGNQVVPGENDDGADTVEKERRWVGSENTRSTTACGNSGDDCGDDRTGKRTEPDIEDSCRLPDASGDDGADNTCDDQLDVDDCLSS